ncbi:MAG: class GN sortase [Xanthomonadales bacterium]|nr:class GN sortase [Xanthomonadales bacterium]
MNRHSHVRRGLLAAVAATAAFFLLQAAWIPAKAELAQVLLWRAWAQTRADGQPHRPWPWADTWPVAVLRADRFGIRQAILDGASGRNLAFGPVALPGNGDGSRDWVLSAHRDTHFAWLRDVRQGERLVIETRAGRRAYRVTGMDIVDSRESVLVRDATADRLTLVTCWPFDALDPGGPLRYVVTALPERDSARG